MKKRKKKGKLLEDFGLGYRSEPSHDYAGSSLFDKKYYDKKEKYRDKREQISDK